MASPASPAMANLERPEYLATVSRRVTPVNLKRAIPSPARPPAILLSLAIHRRPSPIRELRWLPVRRQRAEA
jgi:hypothetical protein